MNPVFTALVPAMQVWWGGWDTSGDGDTWYGGGSYSGGGSWT